MHKKYFIQIPVLCVCVCVCWEWDVAYVESQQRHSFCYSLLPSNTPVRTAKGLPELPHKHTSHKTHYSALKEPVLNASTPQRVFKSHFRIQNQKNENENNRDLANTHNYTCSLYMYPPSLWINNQNWISST